MVVYLLRDKIRHMFYLQVLQDVYDSFLDAEDKALVSHLVSDLNECLKPVDAFPAVSRNLLPCLPELPQ